jgi:hypothetical protein
MPSDTLERLLAQLEELKRPSGERAQAAQALSRLAQKKFKDAQALIRFHETLLFMRAYPQSVQLLREVELILSSFIKRVRSLEESGADLSPLDNVEVSGISGTSVEDTFSYCITRWLAHRHTAEVSVDWDSLEDEYRLAATWPRFLPLLEEDALVEANVPYLDWLRAAKGGSTADLSWLIERFERLSLSEKEKAELYESLKLYVRWELGNTRATRTRMKRRAPEIFYHTEPLLRRSDVSLEREFNSPPIKLERLARQDGEAILELARETSTVRYRELYGFTHGDVARVLRAHLGRGTELFIMGVPPARRLPLRAYHAGLVFKNGVPVCYVEGLSIFERMEIGFNVYYTFREGESAWIYARLLKIFKQLLGVTAFSIDPYQLGYENEEGIESGSFWFYRKLGWRPVLPAIAKLMEAEERKLAAQKTYRTPTKILRRLAEGHMLLETPPARRSAWDSFRIRNVGLAVQRRMQERFDGDALKMRRAAAEAVARSLGVEFERRKGAEQTAFEDLALVLSLIPDLARWSADEKSAVLRIIKAKASADESKYLRLLQQHSRLRDEIIKIGSEKQG